MTSCGVRLPFFSGCHSSAIFGRVAARELVTEIFCPAQNGQFVPPLALASTVVFHSWSGPSGHFHHIFRCVPLATSDGVSSPFFVGCHSSASSGYNDCREFVIETLLPRQKGHDFSSLCCSFSDHSTPFVVRPFFTLPPRTFV